MEAFLPGTLWILILCVTYFIFVVSGKWCHW